MSILDSIKKSILVPIHPSGLPFIIIFCLITLIIGWIWSPLFFIGLIFTLWCIYFFRNPERITPENINNTGIFYSNTDPPEEGTQNHDKDQRL